jgi:hypothetical protein
MEKSHAMATHEGTVDDRHFSDQFIAGVMSHKTDPSTLFINGNHNE